jgi:transcriptional antiterminator NusG
MAEYDNLENTDYDPDPVFLEDTPTSNDEGPVIDLEEGRIRPSNEKQWYVIHCYSGQENKVRHSIEQRIETMDARQDLSMIVPTEEEIEVKDGKRRTVERRVFPGYILVEMKMDEDSWYVVRNTPG